MICICLCVIGFCAAISVAIIVSKSAWPLLAFGLIPTIRFTDSPSKSEDDRKPGGYQHGGFIDNKNAPF